MDTVTAPAVTTADTTPAALPTFPRIGTVVARILAALLSGRTLTVGVCFREFNSTSMHRHISALKGALWAIDKDMRPVITGDGREVDVGHYSLTPEAIQAAGDDGRAFVLAVQASVEAR